VLAAPVTTGVLPLGVQLVAAPFREAALFRVAARLEAEGVVAARLAEEPTRDRLNLQPVAGSR
jgi:Asp-tRNA(Asn)/Glu-tRNA(Gln) amidotransferase A subunit family amidase